MIPPLGLSFALALFVLAGAAALPAASSMPRQATATYSATVREKFSLATPSEDEWKTRFAELAAHFGQVFPESREGIVLVRIRSNLRPLEHLYFAEVGFRDPAPSVPVALRLAEGRALVIFKSGIMEAAARLAQVLDGRVAAIVPKRPGRDIYERLAKKQFPEFVGADFSDKTTLGKFWDRFSGGFGTEEGMVPEILIEQRLWADDRDLGLDPAEIADRGLCARVLKGWAHYNLGRACTAADATDVGEEQRLHGRYVAFLERQKGRGLRWEEMEAAEIRALTRAYLRKHYPGLPVIEGEDGW